MKLYLVTNTKTYLKTRESDQDNFVCLMLGNFFIAAGTKKEAIKTAIENMVKKVCIPQRDDLPECEMLNDDTEFRNSVYWYHNFKAYEFKKIGESYHEVQKSLIFPVEYLVQPLQDEIGRKYKAYYWANRKMDYSHPIHIEDENGNKYGFSTGKRIIEFP